MKSPITSPWLAVLTSSATITLTPYSSACARGGLRAGDLVVVGHRDRAEALLARRRQQHLDRRGAVVASGRCACAGRRRSAGARRCARADLRVAARGPCAARRSPRRAPRRSSATRAPRQRGARRRPRSRARSAVVADEPAELRGERLGVARGSNSSPRSPSPTHLVVDRQARWRAGTAPAALARATSAGRGLGAVDAATSDVGVLQQLVLARVLGGDVAHALAQVGAQRRSTTGRCRRARRAPTARRARRGAARAATGAAPGAPPRRRRRCAAARRRARAARSSAGGARAAATGSRRGSGAP